MTTATLTRATQGKTTRDLTATFGPMRYQAVVPAGTAVKALEDELGAWVVSDLAFIEDKTSLVYHDALYRGIRIPAAAVVATDGGPDDD